MEIYPKKPIRIASKAELDKEMRRIQQLFSKGETEETWEFFNIALKNLGVWTLEDKAHEYDGFVDHLKMLQRPLIKTLTTERTRLSGAATEFLKKVSEAMQRDYDQHVHDLFAPTLLRMFARTNKVMLTRAVECYKTIIDHAKLPRMIPKLSTLLKSQKETSKSVRQCVAACLDKLVETNTKEDIAPHQTLIEDAIRMTAMDSAPDVRLAIRCCYKTYSIKFPESASKFEEKLPADIKKYLTVTERRPTSKLLSRTSSASSFSSTTSSTSATKNAPASLTTSHAVGRVVKHAGTRLPRPKSRNSAPQLSTAKLPIPQRPRTSMSASLSARGSKIPNAKRPATPTASKATSSSVLISKPAAKDASTTATAATAASSSSKNSSTLSKLTRATASSSLKFTPKTNARTSATMQKMFMLRGMTPVRPIKRPSSSVSSTTRNSGQENRRPAKKQNVENATQ
ncbi:clasp N terminal-domain-containing protein [Zychaea mexicana]|uniref:clasp N terminal-domain-containing protein n=1 Tax=Zychaea mexicana TaxID=64656 RepID=UPI0022FDFA3A|nr:clasp N terminal-domain-containing protein [Zychaea mexicana]KAI9494960.1 clasp N terminal-domain-containing protein [Zychaea mexicana]